MDSVQQAWVDMGKYRIDTEFVPQHELDVTVRPRTSVYPWRGQFSPGLVERLLDAYALPSATVLDPFVGSGTVLFECVRKALPCYGMEIHPGAVHLARIAGFANLDTIQRGRLLDRAKRLLVDQLPQEFPPQVFLSPERQDQRRVQGQIQALIDVVDEDDQLQNLIAVILIQAFQSNRELRQGALYRSFERTRQIVDALPYAGSACQVLLSDARQAPFETAAIDLVLSSPPYVNVFNYHQNYRPILEILGWSMLDVARSEIGANRKHRGNRFLTVIQYCMEMAQVMVELRRIMATSGRAVFVVGRESRVRGVPFANARLLSVVAQSTGAFALERWQERKFVNRFGETIFEDILTLEPVAAPARDPLTVGRRTALIALGEALGSAQPTVAADIESAMDHVREVEPSPLARSNDQGTVVIPKRASDGTPSREMAAQLSFLSAQV